MAPVKNRTMFLIFAIVVILNIIQVYFRVVVFDCRDLSYFNYIENHTLHAKNISADPLIINLTEIANASRRNTRVPLYNTTWPDHFNSSKLETCRDLPGLGPVTANTTEMDLEEVDKKFPEVKPGGWYKPANCSTRHNVAIVIPFRDRQQHLAILLNHLHPFLMKQQIEYRIFIVEQLGRALFNRGKLLNVGFVEAWAARAGGWGCLVFHDVDLLPLDLRNPYYCATQPRHLSSAVDKFGFEYQYEGLFGGVCAMSSAQVLAVNGYSNGFWGWGGEDDDMNFRLGRVEYHIARFPMSIARYAMLKHKGQTVNFKRHFQLSNTARNYRHDGLTTLKYEVISVKTCHLFTLISVDIEEKGTSWSVCAALLYVFFVCFFLLTAYGFAFGPSFNGLKMIRYDVRRTVRVVRK